MHMNPNPARKYNQDGLCHALEPKDPDHECGKPAVWIGETHHGFKYGFCESCRLTSPEKTSIKVWNYISVSQRIVAPDTIVS
jgi:hypothetical protein